MKYLLALVLVCVSCRSVPPVQGTGVGNAWDQALFGADDAYVRGIQFMHSRTGSLLAQMYAAAEQGSVVDPFTGQVNLQWARTRFRLMEQYAMEIETWEKLSEAVADYSGAKLEGLPDASENAARNRARRFLESLRTGIQAPVLELVGE